MMNRGILFHIQQLVVEGFKVATFLFIAIGVTHANEISRLPLHALVIGNTNYATKSLSSPKLDAKLMSQTLKDLGFKVGFVEDLKDRKAFYDNIRQFYSNLPDGAVAFVYYAGHGVQISGANYLIPTNLSYTSERAIQRDAYALSAMLESLTQAKSVVNIVVLDACRNNPFQPKVSKYRNIDHLGLAKVTAPKGTIVAYSTSPGQLALDGNGSNSVYTSALANEIKKPGKTIEVILKNVADIVRKKTIDDQQPWYESSLVDDFYFIPENGVRMIVTKNNKKMNKAQIQQASRGLDSPNTGKSNEWYLHLSGEELEELDYEIQQRVKYLTEDEIPLLNKRAKAGNVVAMTTLGIAYREGVSKVVEFKNGKTYRINSNNSKSIEFLTKAANIGFPVAQVELGEMLFIGKGFDKNVQRAAQLFEKASKQKYKRAELNLVQAKLVNKDGYNVLNALKELGLSNSH